MEPIVSRLDVTAIFCDVDDFCQQFEQAWAQQLHVAASNNKRSDLQ
jgi:hypothetical protein